MKIRCALCQKLKENKNNTHYLTDGIIRSCLNQDGENVREKGLYYDISNNNSKLPLGFQRNTSPERIKEILGREITDEDIGNATQTPFSVNNVFCKDCEDIFTTIETEFISKVLPEFREHNLTGLSHKRHGSNKLIRLFFLLQIWRTSVCTNNFLISDTTKEELRKMILSSFNANIDELNKFPLSISYLQTLGGNEEFTRNAVGPTIDNKYPKIIFLNDFVIQFYEKEDDIQYDSFYGLNDKTLYNKFVNYKEEEFIFQILSDKERKEFLERKDKEKIQKIMFSNWALDMWKLSGRNRWIYLL